jgi:hypothetical protein
MPSNSKNMKLAPKESSVPTKEVQPTEPTEPEPKSKKMSKTVTVDPVITAEAAPQKGAGKTKMTKDDVKPEPEPEIKSKVEDVAPLKLKGKSKTAEVKVDVAPVKVEDVEPVKVEDVEPVKVKGKSKGKSKVEDEPEEAKEEVKEVPVQKAGGSKSKATKATKADKTTKADEKPTKQSKSETETTIEGEADIEKGVRSFKVQLPGTEDYIGRYTGLTPYQAANKALSKYFRENKTIKTIQNEITFSIRESTRGSKRSTYTYNGKREKLVIPVKYSINGPDGNAREIVKEYKNKLTKVKKGETETEVKVKETST